MLDIRLVDNLVTINKLSKHLEQEQNHRNGDHMEGYQQGEGGGGRMGEKVQGISRGKGTGNKKHKW